MQQLTGQVQLDETHLGHRHSLLLAVNRLHLGVEPVQAAKRVHQHRRRRVDQARLLGLLRPDGRVQQRRVRWQEVPELVGVQPLGAVEAQRGARSLGCTGTEGDQLGCPTVGLRATGADPYGQLLREPVEPTGQVGELCVGEHHSGAVDLQHHPHKILPSQRLVQTIDNAVRHQRIDQTGDRHQRDTAGLATVLTRGCLRRRQLRDLRRRRRLRCLRGAGGRGPHQPHERGQRPHHQRCTHHDADGPAGLKDWLN